MYAFWCARKYRYAPLVFLLKAQEEIEIVLLFELGTMRAGVFRCLSQHLPSNKGRGSGYSGCCNSRHSSKATEQHASSSSCESCECPPALYFAVCLQFLLH